MGWDFDHRQSKLQDGEKLYNIEFVDSNSWNGRKEHAFMGDTYQKALDGFVGQVERDYGFIQNNR